MGWSCPRKNSFQTLANSWNFVNYEQYESCVNILRSNRLPVFSSPKQKNSLPRENEPLLPPPPQKKIPKPRSHTRRRGLVPVSCTGQRPTPWSQSKMAGLENLGSSFKDKDETLKEIGKSDSQGIFVFVLVLTRLFFYCVEKKLDLEPSVSRDDVRPENESNVRE